jgi:hypothetical protein
MPSVGSSSAQLGQGPCLVQNLGPDDLYVGVSDTVTTGDGIRISAGDSASVGFTSSPLYGISSGTSDVRLLAAGTGIYGTVTTP